MAFEIPFAKAPLIFSVVEDFQGSDFNLRIASTADLWSETCSKLSSSSYSLVRPSISSRIVSKLLDKSYEKRL